MEAYISTLRRLVVLLERNGYSFQRDLLKNLTERLESDASLTELCSIDIWGGSGSVTYCNLLSGSGPQARDIAEQDQREFFDLIADLAQRMERDGLASDRVRSVGNTFSHWAQIKA